ncbi:MAG: sulfite exporter TauE/SafE family protein [Pseudomonadota bacterium]
MELTGVELGLFAALLVMTGAVAGVLAGLLGVGGGIVIVPILFLVFGALDFPAETSMHVAVATSLATIIPTSISSARAHHRRGNVDVALLRRWAPWLVLGSLVGGLLSFVLGGAALRLIFGVIALAVAINMAVPRTLTVADALPEARGAQGGIATGIGGFSALMGIGGGTLSVPILSAFRYPTHRAVGTAAAFGLLIALPGVIGFLASGQGVAGRPPYSFGYVNLVAAALIFPATTLFAPLGARIASALPADRLKLVFAAFLGFTALRMLWEVVR